MFLLILWNVHTMYFGHTFLLSFLKPSSPVCTNHLWVTARVDTIKKINYLSQQPSKASSSSARDGDSCPPPQGDFIWLELTRVLCMLTQTLWVHMCNFPLCLIIQNKFYCDISCMYIMYYDPIHQLAERLLKHWNCLD